MNAKKRKMAFYEIGGGKLAVDVQESFDSAQENAFILGQPAEVVLKIKIYPPDGTEERFGKVEYSVTEKVPPKKSILMTTELKNGYIIADGCNALDVIQNELQFDEPPKLLQMNGGSEDE